MASHTLLLLSCAVLAAAAAGAQLSAGPEVAEGKGPPQRRREREHLVVAAGEDIKMVCPVLGNPAPIVEWSKDGENVDYSWTRVKTNKNYLKLRGAQKADTGVWVCRAVNGFGSVSVDLELVVTETSLSESELLQTAAPVFTKRTQSQQSSIKKLTGESLQLRCEALGSPKPRMSWLHNGRPVPGAGAGAGLLRLDKLTEAQSGVYTCLATNLAATAKLQFHVRVEAPRVELPGVQRVDNVTVAAGEAALLQCRVTSSLTPAVQWLRRVEPSPGSSLQHSISLGGMELVTVGGGDTVTLADSSYLSSLVIKDVTRAQAGLYVCFATNSAGGFNYQSAHLSVEAGAGRGAAGGGVREEASQQLVLGLVVGLVTVVLLLLAAIFLCLLKQSRTKLVLAEYAESQRSILYKNCTLDIKTAGRGGLGRADYQDDAVSWSSLQKKQPAESVVCGGGSVTSNIYDLPFSTAKESAARTGAGAGVHYTPLVSHCSPLHSMVHSPQLSASSRVTRVTSLPSSPALTPRNTRQLQQYRHQHHQPPTYITQYQNL